MKIFRSVHDKWSRQECVKERQIEGQTDVLMERDFNFWGSKWPLGHYNYLQITPES